jgi:hypothetical protein
MGIWSKRAATALGLGLMIAAAAVPARANIFTSILREAGEAGGKAASHGASHLGAIGRAAEHLKGLTSAPKGALAAHATPEGHWQFVNREGQVFTAGTPDELKRVLPSLAPDAISGGDTKMSLYLSEESVFQNRSSLDQLPKDADLHVVTDTGTYPVTRQGSGDTTLLRAQIKPNLVANLTDQALFDETASYLDRSLNKSNIRTIALEPGASSLLPSAPKLDAVTKVPLADQLDPVHLAKALRSIRGQTALVVGRVENGKLFFSPSKGPELSRDIEELVSAASQNDVNLVILHSGAARQPGGRNWLWQTVEVGGLNEATKAATFGDFLDALAAKRGGFELAASREGSGRVHITANPTDAATGMTGEASSMLEDAVGHITGEVVTNAIDIHGRDQSAELELDGRLIPGIPTYIQIPYLGSMIAAAISWATIRGWWQRLWPTRDAPDGEGRIARVLRNTPRALAFWLVFVPVAGVPALFWHLAVQTWASVTAPFRWFHRRFLRREV